MTVFSEGRAQGRCSDANVYEATKPNESYTTATRHLHDPVHGQDKHLSTAIEWNHPFTSSGDSASTLT